MDDGLVKTGIDIIGEVPWGTHFCQFYQTKEDLLDTLVPYFKAGLENNEFCMWITSDPLSAEEAAKAMHLAVSDFADRLSKGQIQILPHTDWYLKGGGFDQQRVLDGWVDKLTAAIAAGYGGLRLTGNTFWLEKQDWKSFTDYEAAVNDVIGKYHMLALCTYSLDKCGAAEVMDVIRNHEFALIRKEGQWELIENAIHKQAKQALVESEERYRTIVETSQEGIVIGSPDGRFVFVNQRMADMLGYAKDEMLGRTGLDFMDEDHKELVIKARRHLQEGQVVHAEYKFRRKDGSILWTLCSASAMYDGAGCYLGNLAMHNDITERKQTEEKLRESEERYRALFEGMTEGFALHEIVCNEKGEPCDYRFLEINPAFERLTGLKRDDVIGNLMSQVLPSDDPYWVKAYGEVAITGKSTHFYNRSVVLNRDYEVFAYRPAPRQFAVLFVDITERKQTEENIRVSEARYRGLYEAIAGGVVVQGKDGTIIEANAAAREILGLRLDEITGRTSADPEWHATHEDGSPFPGEEHPAMVTLRTGESAHGVVMGVSNPTTGQRRWILINSEPIRDFRTGQVQAAITTFLDITELVLAQEALRESEARLKKAQEIAHLGSWEFDLLNNHLYWSDEVYRIFGLQPQQFDATYEGFLDAVHPDDRASVDSAYSSSLAEGRDTYEIEHRIVRRSDGVIRFVSERCEHIRDSSGRVTRSMGMVHDVTERKQAEESLRETRDHLDSLLNYANAPIIVWDPELRITKFNRAFQRLTGHRESEALGQRLDMLFPRESKEASLSQIHRAMAGERWETVEIPILRVDGEVRTVLWNSANIHAADGVTTVATIAQGQDITERKLAEKALRESEEGHRHVFEAAMDGFWVTDLSGRLLQVNDAYCQMSGYTRQELLGMRVSDVEAVEKPEETAEHIKRVLSQGQDRFETRHRHKDGRLIDIEVSVKYSDIRGGQLIVSARDITERKRTEDQLEFQVNILSNLFDAVVAVGSDHRVTYWNRVAEDLYAVPAGQAIGQKVGDLYQQVWLNSSDERDYTNDLATKGYWTGENIHLKKNGERIYVRSSVSMMADDDGGNSGMVSVIRDRTKLWQAEQEVKILNERLRYEAEERLKATDASFRRAIASSADGIVVVRKDGVVRFANPAAEGLLGRGAGELIGTLFRFPLIEGSEIEIAKQNGEEAIAEMRIVELDWEGAPAYLATLRDVTRRKEGLLALQESETRLRLLLDQIPCVSWTLDTRLRFTSFTGSAMEAYKVTPDQMLGLSLADYFKEEDVDFVPYAVHRQALQGTPATYELSLGGRTFYGRVEPLRDADDRIVGVVGVAFDITDRKLAEEQLRNLSHRLVSAQENERRKIARELHDEVGQSLTALKLCVDKISLSGSAGDGSELREAREALRELMAQVRSMSLELRPTMLDDLGLLPTLLWHFKRYKAQTKIRVNFRHCGLRRDLPQDTSTAAYRIVQEALTNVARYAKVEEVLVVVRAEHDALLVEVEDQGVGFDLDNLAYASTGLSGMRERALSLNGKLLVQSKVGEGTCIIAELPLAKRSSKRRRSKENDKRSPG